MAAARSPCGGFKTRVLRFKVKNMPFTGQKLERECSEECSVFCGEREAFHQEIVLRGIHPCFLHGGVYGLF